MERKDVPAEYNSEEKQKNKPQQPARGKHRMQSSNLYQPDATFDRVSESPPLDMERVLIL